MTGGCSKHGESFSKHISTFYAYDTYSPRSEDNNCLVYPVIKMCDVFKFECFLIIESN